LVHHRMELAETFEAWGHPNIRSTHKTTLMVTREKGLTLRGDCIVAVKAEKGLKDLDPRLKELIRCEDAKVTLTIEAGDSSFIVTGRGHPRLSLNDPVDMVIRKSGYICDRTLMIGADKAACDIPSNFATLLQEGDQRILLTISAETVTQRDETRNVK
jgi:hypothetical protein